MRLIKAFNDAIRSRAFLHWSPRYLYNRFRLYLYENSHPDYPWLTQHANEILSHLIKKDHIGFEWGAGRSTLWFARRCKHLTSVEHDPFWYKKVYAALQRFNVTNCDLVLAKDKQTYISLIDSFEDESLDFVLVDGLYRDECAIRSLRKIKGGGLLIIDNINWYIPSPSKSPGSRKVKPASPIWESLSEQLKKWYCIWTTNGVTDTAIHVKLRTIRNIESSSSRFNR